jgi:hypothetical protein
MQIDFHHAVTYVAARLAGFADSDARIVAWSAQYVDDATQDGYITFDNRGMYYRIASAHKMLDYRNLDELSNHHAWIPFHFLPGNESLPAGEGHGIELTKRLICRPDSFIARDMVEECIRNRGETPYSLYQLGIAMHVYADTWAHQGFSGISDHLNKVHDLRDVDDQPYRKMIRHINDYYSLWSRIKNAVKEWFGIDPDETATELINDFLPLGHGAALSMPDKPFLVWRYKNDAGKEVVRDNPKEFLEAADSMCKAMQRFLGNPADGLPTKDKYLVDELLRSLRDDDYTVRHQQWLDAISRGAFSFGKVDNLHYIDEGAGSWKDTALCHGQCREDQTLFPYEPSFLETHWKLFHDALQAHRLFVLHELLPRYGICAA